MGWGQPPQGRGLPGALTPRLSPQPIPTKYKAAVYYFGFDWREIVELEYLDTAVMRVRVHLRSRDGGMEWKGILEQPPYQIPMPVTRVADLVHNTQDCPTCRGSGKIERLGQTKRVTPK